MRMTLMTVAMFLLAGAARAGPNAGGTLLVHNCNLVYAGGPGYSACGQGSAPEACASANTEIVGSDNTYMVWKVYATFAPCSGPRLRAMDIGIDYPSSVILIDHGNCAGDPNNGAFEQDGPGWPASGTGCAIQFQHTQTGVLAEAYWFAGYAYYGTPGVFALGPGPYGGLFADDAVPPNLDTIAGYGRLGFNMPGSVSCPSAVAEGACCIGSACTMTCESECQGTYHGPGTTCDPNPCTPVGACCIGQVCYVCTETQCLQNGGRYFGDGTSCVGNVCIIGVPTKTETWGRIKNSYR